MAASSASVRVRARSIPETSPTKFGLVGSTGWMMCEIKTSAQN